MLSRMIVIGDIWCLWWWWWWKGRAQAPLDSCNDQMTG